MRVIVHNILTGAAAEVGAVRINLDRDEAVILAAASLSVDDEAALLGELLAPDDMLLFAERVQRVDPIDGSESAVA